MAAPLPPLKTRNIRCGGDLMGVDILLLDSQECEAKSETEEDEELRLIRLFVKKLQAKWSVTEQAAEENDKQRRVTQHSAVSNAALGGEKRRKRQRVTEKVVEEQQNNGGEQ